LETAAQLWSPEQIGDQARLESVQRRATKLVKEIRSMSPEKRLKELNLMTTEVLRKKTGRYLCGLSVPSERRQIQNWLSCTGDHKSNVSPVEREIIEERKKRGRLTA